MLESQCELEAPCARLASQRMSSVEKGLLESLHERVVVVARDGNVADYLTLNHEFHDHICSGVHNVTLWAMANNLRERLAPFRQVQAERDQQRMARAVQEHQVIVEGIRSAVLEKSYEAMRAHNGRQGSSVMVILQQRLAFPGNDKGGAG